MRQNDVISGGNLRLERLEAVINNSTDAEIWEITFKLQ